jgi:hypothetical protein
MQRCVSFTAAVAAALAGVAFGAPLSDPVATAGQVTREVGEITVNGSAGTVVRYTWPDSLGRARSVALLPPTSPGGGSGWAVRMTFQVNDGALRTVNVDYANAADGGFGYFVSHEAYRRWSDGSESSPIAFKHANDDSPLGRYLASTGTAQNGTAYANGTSLGPRAVHEFRHDYPRWGTIASIPDPDTQQTPAALDQHQLYQIPIVIRWSFTAGQDYPYWSVEADLTAVGDKVAMDVRGPYGTMYFNEGVGNAVTAVRWGERFKFAADAGAADLGAVATPADSLAWTWTAANTGRRYNVLGSGNYEFGIVTPTLASQWPYGESYANNRGRNSPIGDEDCQGGMLSLPCYWEWPMQSMQYDFGPPSRPKLAWGASPYIGTSITTVYTSGTTTVPLAGKGRIHYGVHIVYGRGGAGTPLTLAQAAAPVGGPHNLELRVAPKVGGSAGYRVLGDGTQFTDRNRSLPAWSSVLATATPAGGYQLLGFDHDCGTLGGCTGARACAGSTECRFAMDAPLRTVAVFALAGTTLAARPLFLDFPAQAAGSLSAAQSLKVVSLTPASQRTVNVQSNSAEFVVSQDASLRPCSAGHDAAQLTCGVFVQFAPSPGPPRTVQATLTITSNQSAPVTVDVEGIVTAGVAASADMDLNGDGRSDILFRRDGTGATWRLLMNGNTVSSAASPYQEPDTNWKIVGNGDFNADGVSDLAWRHVTDGRVAVLLFNNAGQVAQASLVMTEANQAWKIVGTPDIDADGGSDLLWWNSQTGQVWVMLMNGAAIKAQGALHSEPDTNWRIVATGDFRGSGRPDQLLWRHAVDGRVYLMTAAYAAGTFSRSGAIIYQEANAAWQIVTAADFNGDGRDDILWRNSGTGQVYMMLMDGNTIAGGGVVYTEPDTAWNVVAAGDYDGDGKADILFYNNTNGRVWRVRMDGLAVLGGAQVYQEAQTLWKIQGPASYRALQ